MTIDESFVSFPTATLARDKGFNELDLCTRGFNPNTGELIIQSWYTLRKVIGDDYILLGQPTQTILRNWLRSLHKIDITIITDWIQGERVYYLGLSYINKNNEIDIWFHYDEKDKRQKVKHTNYDVALENGLFKALTLI